MGTIVVPPGFISVTLKGTLKNGHKCAMQAGYSVTAPFTQSDANALCAEVMGPLSDVWTNPGTVDGCHFIIGNDGPPLELDSTSGAGTGGRGGAAATPQVSFLIRKRTGFAGRKFRGRMYVPCVLEADVDDVGLVSGTAQSLLATFAAAVQGPGTSHIDQMVLLHSDSTAPTPIVDFTIEKMVATQRRRLSR
jgi:hypothetical protein